MSLKTTHRTSGFYRVKEEGKWTVAKYDARFARWDSMGEGGYCDDDSWDEINPEPIPMPDGDSGVISEHEIADAGSILTSNMTINTLPPAYERVRDELIEEGYDEPMQSKADVRSTLRGMLLESEQLERRYRDFLSELDDADDEASA